MIVTGLFIVPFWKYF